MSRQARKIAESGINHVILRGINKQNVFEDREDRTYLLSLLIDYKAACGYGLLAYCLMSNHIHILVRTEEMALGDIVQRIAGRYASWFNNKYQRCGHLFEGRYKSEPVDDEGYLLNVIRYIHRNPLAARITDDIGAYPYSSYADYFDSKADGLTDTEFVFGIIDKEDFRLFHEQEEGEQCLEVAERRYFHTDEQARQMILSLVKGKSALDMQKLDIPARNEALAMLKVNGLSVRQLSRLTGISKSVIARQ